jgi:CheY-like chemotaxis protein
VTIQGSVAPLFNDQGKIRGVVGVCVDITGRKQAEEALRASNRRKDEFLAALSHELRTPLTPVLMAVSAVLENPPPAEEIRPILAMIRDNVELEARLIDDLLDVARITQGKMQLKQEVVDVHALIFRTLETCRDVIQTGRFHLALELMAAEHHAVADPVRLQQVFWNLIKNAAKFTPAGGTIAIRSRNEPGTGPSSTGGCLIVEVSDTGVGIEPDALAKIFQVFEQGDSSFTRRFGGLGLGLSISQAVVHAHGGRLTAASAGKDRGASFTVSLSAGIAPAPEPSAPPPLGNQSSRRTPVRILLVEDNEDTLRYLAGALAKRRYTVRTAADLASARKLVASEDFDLVISDIGLPDGTGLDLMDEIKRTRGLPGIAISGFGSDEDIQMSKAAGFVEHLTKPITFQVLEEKIRQVVLANTPAQALS